MIVLLRHAEAQGGQGRFIGGTDLPLSVAGQAQAEALAAALAPVRPRAVFASPLARAQATARPLAEALGLPVGTLPGLAEIDLGTWDGQPREAVRAADPAAYAARGRDFTHFRPPGGESFAQLQARALAALATLTTLAKETETAQVAAERSSRTPALPAPDIAPACAPGNAMAHFEPGAARFAASPPSGPVVAVTHAGVIRAVLCHALGMPLEHLFRLEPLHARTTLLRPRPGGFTLLAFNLPPAAVAPLL